MQPTWMGGPTTYGRFSDRSYWDPAGDPRDRLHGGDDGPTGEGVLTGCVAIARSLVGSP